MDEAKKNAFFKDWKDAPTDPAKAVAFQNGWYKGFDAGLAAKQLEYDSERTLLARSMKIDQKRVENTSRGKQDVGR